MSAKAVTANRLADGRVVYLAVDGAWSEHLTQAAWSESEEGHDELLARAEADAAAAVVVEPYLFAVSVEHGAPAPVRLRELIRGAGPTVRRDLGKQARFAQAAE